MGFVDKVKRNCLLSLPSSTYFDVDSSLCGLCLISSVYYVVMKINVNTKCATVCIFIDDAK